MNLYHYVLMLLTVSGAAMGQDIPKKAEAITVTTTLPDSLLFEATLDALDKAGYAVLRSDSKRGSITTDHRLFKGLHTMRILANVSQNVTTLRAQWSASFGNASAVNSPASNTPGLLHTSDRIAFAELNKLAIKMASDVSGAVGYAIAE